jgi:hypothetical protein
LTSPRWLIEKERFEEARKSLGYLREGAFSNVEIEAEFDNIKQSVEVEKLSSSSWTALFTQRHLFSRLWRAALLQFMAQMCGATAMKYYLPTLFTKLGLGHQLSLLVGGIESTLKIGCTIIEMQLIDRFGRRITLLTGCVVMFIAMLVSPRSCAYSKISKLNSHRSMAHYPKHILEMSITHLTMPASCSFSSSPLAIRLDLDRPLGYMEQRYAITLASLATGRH